MPRLDLAFGPPARHGVTTLMSVGADDPVTPVLTIDDYARRGTWASGGLFVAGFLPADAVIEGDSVLVSSPQVLRPSAVRYAWADNPDGANLYNAEGCPASPFRSDAW